MCKILRNIVASAAEAEYGALFLNGQAAVPIRTTLIEIHHTQPPTPIQVDNSTAVGIANKSIKQKRSKAMDIRFHWMLLLAIPNAVELSTCIRVGGWG